MNKKPEEYLELIARKVQSGELPSAPKADELLEVAARTIYFHGHTPESFETWEKRPEINKRIYYETATEVLALATPLIEARVRKERDTEWRHDISPMIASLNLVLKNLGKTEGE